MWWCVAVIPVLVRQRQEDHEFEGSLGYRGRESVSGRSGRWIQEGEEQTQSLLMTQWLLVGGNLTPVGGFKKELERQERPSRKQKHRGRKQVYSTSSIFMKGVQLCLHAFTKSEAWRTGPFLLVG